MFDQQEEACGFEGFAVRTLQDPSTGTCNFTIQLETTSDAAPPGRRTTAAVMVVFWVLAAMVTLV